MIDVVYAREPLPESGPVVFLAGPTPRSGEVASWRPAALDLIASAWDGPDRLTVFTPESRGGIRAREYHDQVEWEAAALNSATAILFWIPRDIATMPGFTTNVEFGLHIADGNVVLGCPPECANPERNRYLIWTAHQHGAPVTTTLAETVTTALGIVAAGARWASC